MHTALNTKSQSAQLVPWAKSQARVLFTALDALDQGLVLLTAELGLIDCNALGSKMLTQLGVSYCGGRLVCSDQGLADWLCTAKKRRPLEMSERWHYLAASGHSLCLQNLCCDPASSAVNVMPAWVLSIKAAAPSRVAMRALQNRYGLTKRELEVALAHRQGSFGHLGLSKESIRSHRKNIFQKMQVSSQIDMVQRMNQLL